MVPSYLLDESGKHVTLGRELGRGGEATVYVVREYPQIVAKIYHRQLDAETAEKISRMVALQNERLLKLAAWPLATLRNGNSSSPAGVLMRNVSGFKDVHLLYSPKSRVREFSAKANWRFLVHSAGNVARAFSVIHEQGHVIGDVNQSNVRVSPETAIAHLIDCDSFQISFRGRYYLCKVGAPLYTPPELQGKDFSEVVRTPNHDNFGLAVLVFHLLFMGRHPFAGRFLGRGDMPIENAIGECRFAFAPDTQRTQMEPPPNCITLEDLSPEAGELFIKAFAPWGPQNRRPTGDQWAAALDSLSRQLRACSANRAHVFFQRLLRCPWCAIEGRTGVFLFLGYAVAAYGNAGFNIKACWAQIMTVPGPGPGSLPDFRPVTANIKPTSPARVAGWKRKGLTTAVVLLGVTIVVACLASDAAQATVTVAFLCFAGAKWIINKIERYTKAKFEAESRACDARLGAIEDRWQREASGERFKNRLKDLKRLVQEYNDLPMRRQQRISDLERDLYNLQLTRFLERFHIASADIPHVKDTRKAMLSSYGIDTAADVNLKDLAAVPGFGDFLTAEMMNWRRSLEREFRFDSKRGVHPADLRRVDQELGKRRIEIELTLSQGRHDLEETCRRIILARGLLRDELEKAHIEAAQAWANVEAA
jgi:DNA-binding helix-hairpin-helix protein with protein kinase domain